MEGKVMKVTGEHHICRAGRSEKSGVKSRLSLAMSSSEGRPSVDLLITTA